MTPLLTTFLVLALSLSLVRAAPPTISLDEAVAEGIAHFQSECARQQAFMPELLTALKLKDMSRSRVAYVAARPPYEQIETLANVFPDLDAAIDARPYAFPFGEDNPLFEGFHRIERDLYRDQDLTPSYETAVALNDSINALCHVLADVSNFDPASTWVGLMALAYEVPAKKISSEEETWSDLSLMIFRNNFRGLWSQAAPFFRTGRASIGTINKARMRYEEVQAVLNKIDPDNAFFTNSGDARPYSNVTIPERKTIIDASYLLADALAAVRDELNLPKNGDGDDDDDGAGDGLDTAKYAAETAEGVAYFLRKCREQEFLLTGLETAVAAGDLMAAQRAYEIARPPYEQIETIAPSFVQLDRDIDARPYALPLGERDPEWRGFHKVERQLFRDADLPGARETLVVLRGSVRDLCATLQNDDEAFTAERTWEGLIALAFEVPAKKISSEEETWSDLSVMIFRENVFGVQSQYAPFGKRLPAGIASKVDAAFEQIRSYMTYVVDRGNPETGTNFRNYSEVPVWERKTISDLFYEYGRALRMAYDALL